MQKSTATIQKIHFTALARSLEKDTTLGPVTPVTMVTSCTTEIIGENANMVEFGPARHQDAEEEASLEMFLGYFLKL